MMAEDRRTVLRFGLVGLLATGIHVAVFLLLADGAGLDPTLATALAFLVATAVSYLANHSWTFGLRGGHRGRFGRYLVVALAGAGLNMAIMRAATAGLGWSKEAGLAAVLAVVPACSYLANRYWSFRRG